MNTVVKSQPNVMSTIEIKGQTFRVIERNGLYTAQRKDGIWRVIAQGYKTVKGAEQFIEKYSKFFC